jgi:hypothetical protein
VNKTGPIWHTDHKKEARKNEPHQGRRTNTERTKRNAGTTQLNKKKMKCIWDVPFEIRHGMRLMVPDFLDFFFVIL